MNKKYIAFVMMAMFAITFVVAVTYVVNSFTITTDVYEPFEVQYVILGNGGNYEGGACPTGPNADWIPVENGASIDVQGLYAGESRKICTKIVNAGEGAIDYSITSDVTAGPNSCKESFEDIAEYKTVAGSSTQITGSVLNIDDGATPAKDCVISIAVTRGDTA